MQIVLTNDKKNFFGLCVKAVLCDTADKCAVALTEDKAANGIQIKLCRLDGGETAEEALRRGCKDAVHYAVENGYKDIAFDLKSFVDNCADIPYVTNVLIEELSDIAAKENTGDMSVTLFSENDRNEELICELDEELSKPVIKIFKHAYGDFGDPLKEEFEEFQKSLKNEKNFREYLVDLMDRKGIRKSSELYKPAGVSKYTFSKIINFSINPPHKPSKETVAALTIGLKLSLEEAEEFYGAAGYHLGATEFVDRVIRFFILKGIYRMYDVNCCLEEHGHPPLGEKVRGDKIEIKIK